jgi:phosphatidylserine/phosphatidylglycerophosphate/cardiolipin synthase-like enzyme
VQRTLDIVAYEFNSPALTQAVLDAKARGIRVRVVTDNEAGLNDDRTTLNQLVAAGIPVVTDERSALMHNKFMILDGEIVVTGSWNFTINDTYRNNNNVLILRSQAVVTGYQAEFDEMFIEGRFGPTSPANTVRPSFTQDGIPVQLYFGPEDDPMDAMIEAVANAQDNIRFMTFSFTHDGLTDALLNRASGGLDIAGIFETTGSMTQYAALPPLACAGIAVRQDGNPFVLHHKVFIIDNTTVVTGSFNFSANATNSNDENMVIISDPALASQYLAEWTRRWNEGRAPALTCS